MRYHIEKHGLTATLNRPERLNALNLPVARELCAVFDHSDDNEVWAVILTGAGRAFCAGFDLERANIFDLAADRPVTADAACQRLGR